MVYNPYSLGGGFALGGGFGGFGGFGTAGDPNQYDPFAPPGGQQPQFGPWTPYGAPMDPYTRVQQGWGAPQAPPAFSVSERNDQARNVPIGRDAQDIPGFTSLAVPATSSMPLGDDDLSKAMALSHVSSNSGSDGPAIEATESEKPTELSGLQKFGGALGSVSNALLGFAGGALSGAPGNSGIGLGFQGMLQGSKLDQQNRLLRQREMEKERKAAALKAFFAKRGLSKDVMDVAASDPETGLNIFEKLLTPKGAKYERVGNDLVRTNDDGTVEVVHRAPPNPSTSIINTQQGAYEKQRGEDNAKDLKTYLTEGAKGGAKLASLNRMHALTYDPNFRSGFAGETQLKARQLLVAAGLASPDIVKSTEEFHSHAAKSILDGLGGSLGSGVSNADAILVSRIAGSINNTPEANRLIIDAGRRFVKRQMEISKLAAQYERENKGFDSVGFQAYLEDWAEKNPMWTQEETKQIMGETTNHKVGNAHGAVNQKAAETGVPTATGRNGEKIILRDGKWVPVTATATDPMLDRMNQVY